MKREPVPRHPGVTRRTWRDPSGRTVVRFDATHRGADRRKRTRSFQRLGDADRWLRGQRSKIDRGEWQDPERARMPFAEWAAKVEAGRVRRRASTVARDESIMRGLVLPTFGRTPLGAIAPDTVRAWVKALQARGLAPATVRKAYQLLARTLRQAVADRVLTASPCVEIELPELESGEMRFLTAAEVDRLADAMTPRHRATVLTAAFTGARFGELAALRVTRLNLLARTMRITETVNEVRGQIVVGPPKTKAADRTVSLPTFLVDVLAAHLAAFPPGDDGLVFTSRDGTPLRRGSFRRWAWLPAVRAAGLDPLRFHDLRHSHVALLIAQGEHPKVIAARLGHESVRTVLDVYGHLYDEADREAADRLDATRASASSS